MASIITHPVVPIAIALGLGRSVISSRLLIAGSLLTILPDADVISFILGIPYASDFGHRGFTHSLVFGLGIGLCFLPFAKFLESSSATVFGWIAFCTISHGIIDALTNGGLGVAFYWPVSGERLFLPWQVIEVSPIGISQFFTLRGWDVFLSEIKWVWLPMIVVGISLSGVRILFDRE